MRKMLCKDCICLDEKNALCRKNPPKVFAIFAPEWEEVRYVSKWPEVDLEKDFCFSGDDCLFNFDD